MTGTAGPNKHGRETRVDDPAAATPPWKRLAWFGGLWIGGVLTLLVIASVIRWAIL